MKTLPAPQPALPARASVSRPARIGTLGLAFFFAAFVLLAWGAMRDAAHADEAVEAAPLVVSSDESSTESGAAEEVAPPEPEPDTAPPVDEAEPVPVETETVEAVEPVETVEAPAPEPIVADEAVVAVEAPPVVVEEAAAEPVAALSEAVVQPASESVETAVVAPPAVHQCNADTFPTSAGWEATCVVTVENTVGNDGATSSTVTTTWCLAEAGVLPPEGCDSETVTNDQLVTTVDQCNGILAGGSNVTCSVEVINNVPFGTPTTGVTVNQCIGSGQGGVSPGGPPTDCDPEDSSTTGATVTQCNGSANGGGAPERVQCSVVGAVTAILVTVNQCNGSTAAGSTVTCDVTYTNNFAAAVVEPDDEPVVPVDLPDTTPTATTTAGTTDDDSDRSLTSRSGSSSRSSRSSAETATATTRSLAATGASVTTLLFAALLLLALGGLLLAGSNRRLA